MTIIYEYRKIEKNTDKKIVYKHFTNQHALESFLRKEYAALTQFEQASATEEFEELIESIYSSGWGSVLDEMPIGEQNEIPFYFESNNYFFSVDIILHKETDMVKNCVLYDYTITEGTANNIIQRYLFDDMTSLRSMLLDEFCADVQSKNRIKDYKEFETAFVNVDTAYYNQAIAKMRVGLDLNEISTIHFEFVADGRTHNVDVLIKGV